MAGGDTYVELCTEHLAQVAHTVEVTCKKYLEQCPAQTGGLKDKALLVSSVSLLMFMSYPALIIETLTDQYGGWVGVQRKWRPGFSACLHAQPVTQGGFSASL